MTLANGYDRTKSPSTAEYRAMTIEEAKGLRSGQSVWFLSPSNGRTYRAKVSGAPKTWKRDASRCEVPLKYGLREHFTARPLNSSLMQLLLVKEEV